MGAGPVKLMVAILALATGASGCAAPRLALDGGGRTSPQAAAGERFARRACAGCHELGPRGASPNPHAPPFRTLAERLPGEALGARLGDIASNGHREMPPIYMTPEEIAAVAAYIRSVQPRRWT